jgi:hypothetical protein
LFDYLCQDALCVNYILVGQLRLMCLCKLFFKKSSQPEYRPGNRVLPNPFFFFREHESIPDSLNTYGKAPAYFFKVTQYEIRNQACVRSSVTYGAVTQLQGPFWWLPATYFDNCFSRTERSSCLLQRICSKARLRLVFKLLFLSTAYTKWVFCHQSLFCVWRVTRTSYQN